jgi:hypothetical protein
VFDTIAAESQRLINETVKASGAITIERGAGTDERGNVKKRRSSEPSASSQTYLQHTE